MMRWQCENSVPPLSPSAPASTSTASAQDENALIDRRKHDGQVAKISDGFFTGHGPRDARL
jgi:hypothetical protein